MHCRRPFYLHVTRWNGHAINNHSQLRETTSFSCANARDNASSLVWHPKARSRQPEIIHPAGIAIGRVRTRRSHPNVHNCESGGRFPPRENLRVPLSTFAPQPSKLFNRPTGFYFAVHLRERRRSLKTSAKKTWRHLPPPLGLLSRGGVEAKRPRCFENALLNRSTSPCFPPSKTNRPRNAPYPRRKKWSVDEMLVLFKPILFYLEKGEGKGGRVDRLNRAISDCLFVSARKCRQSTRRQREGGNVLTERRWARIADWFRVFRRKWETHDEVSGYGYG